MSWIFSTFLQQFNSDVLQNNQKWRAQGGGALCALGDMCVIINVNNGWRGALRRPWPWPNTLIDSDQQLQINRRKTNNHPWDRQEVLELIFIILIHTVYCTFFSKVYWTRLDSNLQAYNILSSSMVRETQHYFIAKGAYFRWNIDVYTYPSLTMFSIFLSTHA